MTESTAEHDQITYLRPLIVSFLKKFATIVVSTTEMDV